MLRIFSAIIVLGIICFFVVLIVGFISSPSYERTMSALYFDRPDKVWQTLVDIEGYPKSKGDVQQLEILERNFNSINKWREIVSDRETRIYEVLKKESPKVFVLKMKNTKTGLEGVWTYEVSQSGDSGKVTITEESVIDNIFWRGLITIFGRERNINLEFKWLRVELFEELLTS